MRLTQLADYSVRVLIYLAVRPNTLSTVSEISDSYGISRNHLTKVVHQLGQAGYLKTVRGRAGGITLAKPAADINIGGVVRLMETPSVLVECFPGGKGQCVISPACAFKHVLAEAQEAFFSYLENYTLASITANCDPLQSLLKLTEVTHD